MSFLDVRTSKGELRQWGTSQSFLVKHNRPAAAFGQVPGRREKAARSPIKRPGLAKQTGAWDLRGSSPTYRWADCPQRRGSQCDAPPRNDGDKDVHPVVRVVIVISVNRYERNSGPQRSGRLLLRSSERAHRAVQGPRHDLDHQLPSKKSPGFFSRSVIQ